MWSSAGFSRPAIWLAAAAGVWLLVSPPAHSAAPRFYPDDPLWVDDDMTLDASGTKEIEDSNGYDFVVNSFVRPGEKRDVRALNVNTVDEVPDSSWFSNRIGRAPIPLADLVRGPDRHATISLDGWVVSGGKSTGVQPGFRMLNPREGPRGTTYQIEFDPPSNPEMATGAEIIGTAFYHAFGYHTVDVYLAELDPKQIVINKGATIKDPLRGNRRRSLTRDDIDSVLRRAARLPNGRYRVLASRFADGVPRGNFRYYGIRPDDPNDVVPHEHRRELRAARVFGAWLNHDDSRGVNSLDFLTTDGARRYIKHYMFDFGSILGSGTVFAQRHRAGHEYIFEAKPGWLTLATLGLYTRPWLHIDYPDVPKSIGRFEGDAFEAAAWKPEYPNQAFANMRADDAFWAARIVSKFSDEAIRTIVDKARYSEPRAAEFLTATLIKRRDNVVKTWLTGVNPLVDFALATSGALTFADAAVQAGVAAPASEYRVSWARFDNLTNQATRVGDEVATRELKAQAPATLMAPGGPEFIEVRIAAVHPSFAAWSTPVTVHFRRQSAGWQLVGVTRQ